MSFQTLENTEDPILFLLIPVSISESEIMPLKTVNLYVILFMQT